MVLLVVMMVFCTFSLRPRATLGLCIVSIAALAASMTWLVLHDPIRYPAQVEIMHIRS